MKTVMLVFGTRPEAIKMCPLVNELKTRKKLNTVVCVTGQHRQMLDQVLEAFGVTPDYDLSVMKEKQTLFDITTNILNGIGAVLDEVKPDVVLVHGDTSTTFVTALACFYKQIAVGHVEAGLRTYNIYSPFPEEFNRQAVSIVSKYNFAPTELSKQNLLNEGRDEKNIYITGNTAIDALKTTVKDDYTHPELEWAKDSRLIMITAHRRENLGEPMHNMFRAIRRVMDEHPDVKAIYPIHMNPVVRQAADEELGDCDRIRIIEPLEVLDFHNFLARSFMILTDSGGIQEEAPSLGKPKDPRVLRRERLSLSARTSRLSMKTLSFSLKMKGHMRLCQRQVTPTATALPVRELQIFSKKIDKFKSNPNRLLFL